MSDFRAAQRYASAIFQVSEEQKITDTVSRDFEILERTIRESSEFSIFIRSPIISTEKKKKIFSALFKDNISELTLRFILLLTTKNREGILGQIIEQYVVLRDRARGLLNVDVRTAVGLTPGQEENFSRSLAEATGKKVILTFTVDPSLRGGYTVQYDDTVVDASIQRQLDRLRLRLAEKIS